MDIFTTIEPKRHAAEQWLSALAASKFCFHLDDSPETVIDALTGIRTFTNEQCDAITLNLSVISTVMNWDSIWAFYYSECEKRHDFK